MTKTNFLLLLGALLALCIFSCGDDDTQVPPPPMELITTLVYDLTDSKGQTVTFRFEDLDGDGGMEPTITEGTFTANESYTGRLQFLNESEDLSLIHI